MSPHDFDAARAIRWTGAQAVAPDGRRIGDVGGLVVDRQSGKPQWLLLHRSHEHRCVPLHGIVGLQDRVHIPYSLAAVLAGAPVPEDGALSARHEQQLCATYGVPPTRGAGLSRWERRRTTSLASLDADGVIRWEPEPRYLQDRRPVRELPGSPVPRDGSGPSSHVLRVLIADADAEAGEALRAVVDHHPRLRLASVHRDGPQAITAAIAETPDVAVLAARMPLLSGMEVRDRLHAMLPQLVTVLLDDGVGEVPQALDARTVRAPRSLGTPRLVRVIEVLAMTQSDRTGTGPPAADLISGEPVAPPAR
jgi:CheY-like chemotaxis protein